MVKEMPQAGKPARLTAGGPWPRFPAMIRRPPFRPALGPLLAGLLLLAVAPPMQAESVAGLYEAEVGREALALGYPTQEPPEELPSRQVRRQAFMRAALARVIVRLTGSSQYLADPVVAESLLGEAGDFLTRYQRSSGEDGAPRYRFRFDGEAVRAALWSAGLRVWGAQRPNILVWAAHRGSGNLRLASPDGQPELYKALRRAADRFGLPLAFPLLDAEDRQRVSGQDLLFEEWGGLIAASRRYQPRTLLLVRLSGGVPGSGKADWVLREPSGETLRLTSQADDMRGVVTAGLRELLARLADWYAVGPAVGPAWTVAVQGLPDLEAYARVERGLTRLAAVTAVVPERIEGDRARFRVRIRGDEAQGTRLLGILPFLAPQGRSASGVRVFEYRP